MHKLAYRISSNVFLFIHKLGRYKASFYSLTSWRPIIFIVKTLLASCDLTDSIGITIVLSSAVAIMWACGCIIEAHLLLKDTVAI